MHFCLVFLKVHERYVTRLRRKLQFEGRKEANQRRVILLRSLFFFFFFSIYLVVLVQLKLNWMDDECDNSERTF